VNELAVFAEKGRLRMEIPTGKSTQVLYLSLEDARDFQTQLSQSIIRMFRETSYSFEKENLPMSA
jgi:hypothetical protein